MSMHGEALLRRLEADRVAALLESDTDALGTLLHPELSYVHSIGRVDGRTSLLAVLAQGGLEYHAIEEHLEAFVTSEDRLWAHGSMRSDLTGGGKRIALDSLISVLWVLDDDRWRLRAFQGTAPAPSA